jgi:peptidoglycan/LPS O-acetylase OafA/YrhL
MNFAKNGTWLTGHLWSLSVEEQFYFVWPGLICLIGTRNALRTAAFVAIAAPGVLGILQILHLTAGGRVFAWFPFVADSIATGCVLAGAMPFLRKQAWFTRAVRSPWGLLVPLAIALTDGLRAHPGIFMPFGEWILNLGIAYCIARFRTCASDAPGRFLNCRPMVFVGVLSYSLYLWQQPFLDHYVASTWTAFPLNLCCALALACLSYFLAERPFLRLRKRFQPISNENPLREA